MGPSETFSLCKCTFEGGLLQGKRDKNNLLNRGHNIGTCVNIIRRRFLYDDG